MERTRKHDLAIYALTELLKSRSGVEADAVAVRMLEIEPTNEHAHRARMREFATRGDRANAIRQYNACRTSLQADLGVEPDPETEALRNRIEEVGADTQEALEHVDSSFDRTSPEQAAARIPTRWHIISVSGLVLVALLLGWVGYLKIIDQESRTSGAENSIPDAPSIAVLPLRNLTGDAALDYIGDGISTDIIVGLAHIPDISVIGRDSSIMYKDWDVHSRGIAQDLGVQYLLTGTIRKIGDGMRITAELTNVAQNRLVWVKQFDRDLEKVFEVQDEITLQIVDELEVEIAEGEQALLRRRTTTLPEAYKLFRFAEDSIRRGSKDDLRRGLAYARKAVELDPNFAAGWGILGWLIMQERHFYGDSTGDWLAEPEKYARKALSLDPGHAPGLMLLSFAEMYKRNFQKSLEYGDRAISNWPGSSDINAVYALVLDAAGKYEQASHHIERAMRLSPHYPGWHAKMAGEIMLRLGHFEKAIAYYDEALARNPEDFMLASALSGKAVALKSLGRDREARKSIGSIVEAVPWFTLQYVRDDFSFQKDSDALQSFVDDLRQLGLPEQ